MGTALILRPYHYFTCDTCDVVLGKEFYGVHGNPERFCDLTCCKIFYSRPVGQISTHRRERVQ